MLFVLLLEPLTPDRIHSSHPPSPPRPPPSTPFGTVEECSAATRKFVNGKHQSGQYRLLFSRFLDQSTSYCRLFTAIVKVNISFGILRVRTWQATTTQLLAASAFKQVKRSLTLPLLSPLAKTSILLGQGGISRFRTQIFLLHTPQNHFEPSTTTTTIENNNLALATAAM